MVRHRKGTSLVIGAITVLLMLMFASVFGSLFNREHNRPASAASASPTMRATPSATVESSPTPTPVLGPKSWKIVAHPDPGTINNSLNAVVALAKNNVWAVGSYSQSSTTFDQHTLIEHWDGKNWQIVPSPDEGMAQNELRAIAAANAHDIWAVGDYTDTSTFTNIGPIGAPLIEHWDGQSWSIVRDTHQGASLLGITALTHDNVWAVGNREEPTSTDTFVEHWDGNAWSVVPSLNIASVPGQMLLNSLDSVAAVAPGDIWATGTVHGEQTTLALVEHWDGTAWNLVDVPHPGTRDNALNHVVALTPHDSWAAGSTSSASATSQPLIEHWDGTTWSVVASPTPGASSVLSGMLALAANNVWVSGNRATTAESVSVPTYQALVEHWDGNNWRVIDVPIIANGELLSIAASSASDLWMVGDAFATNGATSKSIILTSR